jgi:hypothetical protein
VFVVLRRARLYYIYIYILKVFSTHRSSGKISGLLVEWNKTSTEGFREFLNKHPLFLNEDYRCGLV